MDCYRDITDKMATQKKESTEMTAESVLETIADDHLKCHICLSTFNDPMLLDCHHTFCKSCLEDLRRSGGHSRRDIDCPDCRQTTSVEGRGTAGLKPDFKAVSLVDNVARLGKLWRKQQGALICCLCDEEAQSVIQCRDCSVLFCQDCWYDHESNHTDHDIAVLDQKPADVKVPKCRKHGRFEYAFYCSTCMALICPMCAATSHRFHEFQDIDEADESAREELCILQSRAEEKLKDYTLQKKTIQENQISMEDQMAELTTKIKEADTDETEKDRILEELREFQDERSVEFSKALETIGATIEWFQHSCDKVCQQANKYELLLLKEKHIICMEDILERTFPTPVIPKLGDFYVSFCSSYISRGKVEITSSGSRHYSDESVVEQILYWVGVTLTHCYENE